MTYSYHGSSYKPNGPIRDRKLTKTRVQKDAVRSSWEDLPPQGFTAAMEQRLATEKERRSLDRY